MAKILVVEDDRSMVELLAFHLAEHDIALDSAADGVSGLRMAESGRYPLVILDLKLPGMDGMEICKRLRAAFPSQMIAILTSRNDDVDRILGFEMGADDYITKPFNPRELVARVKALLRRGAQGTGSSAAPSRIEALGLTLDPSSRSLSKDGQRVELTATEFDLLYFLAAHSGRAFTRQQLLNSVWGYEFSGYENTVNSHINRLRAKVETKPAAPTIIQTVWGVGYRFGE